MRESPISHSAGHFSYVIIFILAPEQSEYLPEFRGHIRHHHHHCLLCSEPEFPDSAEAEEHPLQGRVPGLLLRLAGHRFTGLLQVPAEPELGHCIYEQAEDHDHRQRLDPRRFLQVDLRHSERRWSIVTPSPRSQSTAMSEKNSGYRYSRRSTNPRPLSAMALTMSLWVMWCCRILGMA